MKPIEYFSAAIIPFFILFAVIAGAAKKVRVYDSFVSGAKEGLGVTVKIFPYLLAVFVAIKTFQASGGFDYLKNIFSALVGFAGVPPEAVAMSLVKPLSGSASLGLFADIIKTTGADSMASKMSAVIMGSAETTFYVLAVYLGAAEIKKTKYLVPVCVTADVAGIITAVVVSKLFF